MDLGLKGKHVLITGGSKGIGLEAARLFLEEGAHVSLISRGMENLEAAQKKLNAQGRVHIFAADLGHQNVAEALIDKIEQEAGPIDILVNSAGAAKRSPAFELKESSWHDAMQAKFFTYVHAMNAVLPRMAKRKSGVVVNVIGMGGKVAATIHISGGAANAALMLATAGLASAYAPQGIRVVAVNPGATITERLKEGMAADARAQGVSPEEALKLATAKLPLGRIAEPEEIADTVVYLASQRASYVNGTTIAMDGGLTPLI
jgi:NAD(P)-dependent dehydrogenase (short-subunit alcohol dehydrogenase family)